MRRDGQRGEMVRGEGETCGRDNEGQGDKDAKTVGRDSDNARLRDEMTKPQDGPTLPP